MNDREREHAARGGWTRAYRLTHTTQQENPTMTDTTTEPTQTEQIEAFAALLLEQHNARLAEQGYDWTETVKVHPRKLYTLVDVGPEHNMSGRYMVEHATGIIFGIKGYGKVHRGHSYGTLATINQWNWGGYTARKVTGR